MSCQIILLFRPFSPNSFLWYIAAEPRCCYCWGLLLTYKIVRRESLDTERKLHLYKTFLYILFYPLPNHFQKYSFLPYWPLVHIFTISSICSYNIYLWSQDWIVTQTFSYFYLGFNKNIRAVTMGEIKRHSMRKRKQLYFHLRCLKCTRLKMLSIKLVLQVFPETWGVLQCKEKLSHL